MVKTVPRNKCAIEWTQGPGCTITIFSDSERKDDGDWRRNAKSSVLVQLGFTYIETFRKI
jgi:hypothetical protein